MGTSMVISISTMLIKLTLIIESVDNLLPPNLCILARWRPSSFKMAIQR